VRGAAAGGAAAAGRGRGAPAGPTRDSTQHDRVNFGRASQLSALAASALRPQCSRDVHLLLRETATAAAAHARGASAGPRTSPDAYATLGYTRPCDGIFKPSKPPCLHSPFFASSGRIHIHPSPALGLRCRARRTSVHNPLAPPYVAGIPSRRDRPRPRRSRRRRRAPGRTQASTLRSRDAVWPRSSPPCSAEPRPGSATVS